MPSVDAVDNLVFYTCYYPPDPKDISRHVAGWVAAVDTGTFTHRWVDNGTGGIPTFSPMHGTLFVAYMDGRVAALNYSTGSSHGPSSH